MKFKITILLTLFTFLLNAQNVYKVRNNGNILENNKKLTAEEFREKLSQNPQALELFNTGRTKKTVGNVILITGFASIVGNFIYNATLSAPKVTQSPSGNLIFAESDYSNNMYFVGAGLIVAAIPIKIGFKNKIKKAVAIINEDNSKPKTTSIENTSIIANGNGIGVSITF